MTQPNSLIINSAFEEPQRYWAENPDRTLRVVETRRPAGYEIIDTRENTRRQVAIPLVDDIRARVAQWRQAGYPGATAVTQELLAHWWDRDSISGRQYPFYFCQLEAIETLIWHLEGEAEFRQGINVQGDGGPFERLCNKMATGAGKTTVMAMIITWQVLNALTYMACRNSKLLPRRSFVLGRLSSASGRGPQTTASRTTWARRSPGRQALRRSWHTSRRAWRRKP